MKFIALLSFLFISCLSASAQSYGEHIDLYQDALLVNSPDADPRYFVSFMEPIKKLDAKYSYTGKLKYSDFVGDTLKVVAIKKQPYAERPGKNYLYFQSLKTGKLYSYEYSPYTFYFNVVKQVVPLTQDVFCSDVTAASDKFSDLKMFTSPIYDPVVFKKAKENGPYAYFVNCRTGYSTADGVGKTGVVFLFTDGTRKEFPNAEVDVKVAESGPNFWYTCSIMLNEADVKLFADKKIEAYRLFCADKDINAFDGTRFQYYIKCLVTK